MTKTCETCRFWKMARESRHGNFGHCLRYPAVLKPDPDATMSADGYCGEHQPRQPAEAEAPQPGAADAGLAATEAKTMRVYADHPAGNGLVPIHPQTLRRWADLIDALSATPPRPRIDPETRRVLEEAMRALGSWKPNALWGLVVTEQIDAIRAHLAAHGGGDE